MRPRKRRTSLRCVHATLPVAAGVAGEALVAPPMVATGRPAVRAVGWLPPPQPPRATAAAANGAAMTAAARVMTSASPSRAPTMHPRRAPAAEASRPLLCLRGAAGPAHAREMPHAGTPYAHALLARVGAARRRDFAVTRALLLRGIRGSRGAPAQAAPCRRMRAEAMRAKRGTAGQRAHALPMQESGQERLGRANAPRPSRQLRSVRVWLLVPAAKGKPQYGAARGC
jgi:hypothetical protein